jgi:hypothetical protein
MTWMEEIFIPVRLLRQTLPCFVLLNLDRGTNKASMGIAEPTTLTVLVAAWPAPYLIVELEELKPCLCS